MKQIDKELEGAIAAVRELMQQPVFGAFLNLVDAIREAEREQNPGYTINQPTPRVSGERFIINISNPDICLHITGFDELIDFTRLRRTISNAARNLNHVKTRVAITNPNELLDGISRNYLLRTADSLSALNKLIKGYEIPSPIHDQLEEK
jgi:hypothetical protein